MRLKNFIYRLSFLIALILLVGCNQELARDLTPKDAGRIVSILDQLGIKCLQSIQSNSSVKLSVRPEDSVAAIKIIDTYRLLPQLKKKEEGSSLFPSPELDRKRQQAELIEQIEEAIRAFQGVLDIRIFLHGFNQPSYREKQLLVPSIDTSAVDLSPSASVIVFFLESSTISSEDVRSVIAGATGISAERITVLLKPEMPVITATLTNADVSTPAISWMGFQGVSSVQLQLLIVAFLTFILGVIVFRRVAR